MSGFDIQTKRNENKKTKKKSDNEIHEKISPSSGGKALPLKTFT
jgi:hypothetical protein